MRILWIFFIVLFFVSFSQAKTVSETMLSDLGQQNFVFENPNNKECFETKFNPAIDLNGEIFEIISVHAQFFPTPSNKSFVEIFLNREKIGEISSEKFNDDWGRFNVAQGSLLEENSLEICVKTSFETTKIEIFNDSTIGHYFKPHFEQDDSFIITVNPKEPRYLENFLVTGILKNYGSEKAVVLLKYRLDSLEKETPETELVKGETKVQKTVPACAQKDESGSCQKPGEVEFEYFLKPNVLGPITLLPAIAEFENPFGETIAIESSRPTIRIVEPQIKIKPFIQIQKEQFDIGEKINLKVIITNEGQNSLFNLSLKLNTNSLEILQGSTSQTIELINAEETIEREFTLSSIDAGQFNIDCRIDYLDYNVVQSNCNEVTVDFKNPAVDITIIASAALVILSVAIYAFVNLKK